MAQLSVSQHINLANRSATTLTNRECPTCLICLENLPNEPNEWKISSYGCNCQIEFHAECFITWYSMNRTCPICHTRLDRNSIYLFNNQGNHLNYGELVQDILGLQGEEEEIILYDEPEPNNF